VTRTLLDVEFSQAIAEVVGCQRIYSNQRIWVSTDAQQINGSLNERMADRHNQVAIDH